MDKILKEKGKMYFQFKLGTLQNKNPKILIGLCRSDFRFTEELFRQPFVWVLNLNSGDVFCERKWRSYIELDQP